MKSKAVFLLVIFLFNTIVGFGCALGMEGDDHDKNHSHEEFANHVHKSHEHFHAAGHEHKTTPISGLNFSKEDLCCKSLVNDLVTQSKLIPESSKVQVVFPIIGLPDFIHASFVPLTSIEVDQSVYVDHRERPPNQDIRIVIQSFQI